MDEEPLHVYIVPHTHWDREWYAPFQVFRAQLVDLWDELLALTERDPDFRFLMDGQTVVIDDYLAIKPEARARVDRAIRSRQIQVGPWYTLPDEFLVSGETLVRNLQRGLHDGDAHGGALRAGYLPDSFGHAAQMPQIYRQFGFRHAVVWRGVPGAIDRLAFQWEAPDSTRVLAAYLGLSYSHGVDLPLDGAALAARLRAAVDDMEPFQPGRSILIMNGNDHVLPQAQLSGATRAAGALLHWDARLARLDEYLDAIPDDGWPTWRGELRASSRANVLMGTLSARIPDKQAYFSATLALERGAEPMSALAGLDAAGFLREAWTLILQNAAHDTACGSGIDAVAAEARQRSESARQIAQAVITRAGERLREGAIPGRGDAADALAVWNPSPFARDEPIEVVLPRVPASAQDLGPVASASDADPRASDAPPHRVLLSCGPLIGCSVSPVNLDGSTSRRLESGVSASGSALRNGHLRCEITADGSVTLHHFLTDTRYEGLLRLTDDGDAGDEYNFSPVGDPIVLSPVDAFTIRVLEAGPLRGRLEMRAAFRIPRGLDPDRRRRAADPVALPVRLTLALAAESSRIDVELELEHLAADHRLRVAMPLPFSPTHSHADTAFHVTARPAVALRHEPGAPEWELPTYPMRMFVDATDGRRGLTLITDGLHEYELVPGSPARLMLTLLRAVGWLSRDDLQTRIGHAGPGIATPGAQVPGRHRFRFALAPHAGNWETGESWREAERALLPLQVLGPVSSARLLPSPSITVAPSTVQLAACVPRPRGFDLRLLNASEQPADARIALTPSPAAVTWITLGSEVSSTLTPVDQAVRLRLRPWEIATLRVERAPA